MKLDFSMDIPDALHTDLLSACRDCECEPKKFAAQALEATLAARRLPHVVVGRYGPRPAGTSNGRRTPAAVEPDDTGDIRNC